MPNLPNQTTPINNSISPQIGLPGFMSAPRTFRLQKEQAFAGISVQWFNLFLSWMAICILPLLSIALIRIFVYQLFMGALVALWWWFFFKYFSSYDEYIKNRLAIKYIIDEWYKLHGIYRVSTDLDRLLTYVPIVEVYIRGVIEFVGGRFGVLYKYNAPEVEENDTALQEHINEMKGLLHRLKGDIMIRFIMCSKYSYVSPVLKKLQERMNSSKLPRNLFRLLVSLHDKIKSKKNQAPDTEYYIFIAFGEEIDTLEKAQHAVDTILPGIEDGIQGARMQAYRIENRKQVILEYMNFFRPLGVLKNVLL